MSEENSRPSGSFSTFWHGAVDKMSSKTVKFMPNITKPNEKETEQADTDSSGLTQRQKRRAQVRRAQIEHRQRKQNHIKHLEQDVIDLREMIAAAETQSVLFKHENEAIKTTLAKCNIPISLNPLPAQPIAQPSNRASLAAGFQNDLSTSIPDLDLDWQTQNLNLSETSLVSVNFDEFIDAMCLQISPVETTGLNDASIHGTSTSESTNLQVPNPTIPVATSHPHPHSNLSSRPAATTPIAQTPDVDTLAINFILALEHPCRTHFHAPSTPFNPEGEPSGHTLMASTHLYSSAPDSIFASFAPPPSFPTAPLKYEQSWTAPSLSLENLHAMSLSLPKGDWEITPVQAWFKLAERVGLERLLAGKGRVIDDLKSKLGALVNCFEFGAVVDEGAFWEVVEEVLSGDGNPSLE